MRKSIPQKTERDLLIRNKHCCCICQKDGHGKEINIHHIDGNNAHNAAGNLAVLCLLHASQADAGLVKGKLGSGRKLKPEEVVEYKRQWERRIQDENKIIKRPIPPYRKRQLSAFFYQEMHKVKHEILALDHTDPKDKAIKAKFAFLRSLAMEDYIYDIRLRRHLMDVYTYIAAMAGDSGTLLIQCLIQAMEELNFSDELEDGPIENEVFFLRASIDALEDLGVTLAMMNINPVTLKHVCSALVTVGKAAKFARLTPELKKVNRALMKIKKECGDFQAVKRTNTEAQRQQRQRIVELAVTKLQKFRLSDVNRSQRLHRED